MPYEQGICDAWKEMDDENNKERSKSKQIPPATFKSFLRAPIGKAASDAAQPSVTAAAFGAMGLPKSMHRADTMDTNNQLVLLPPWPPDNTKPRQKCEHTNCTSTATACCTSCTRGVCRQHLIVRDNRQRSTLRSSPIKILCPFVLVVFLPCHSVALLLFVQREF